MPYRVEGHQLEAVLKKAFTNPYKGDKRKRQDFQDKLNAYEADGWELKFLTVDTAIFYRADR